MKRILMAGSLALACLATASTSVAAATCADRNFVVTQLEERFGETLRANTISASSQVLGVYASPKAETWSVIVTLPERNLACLAATGRGDSELQAYLLTR